VFLVLLVGVFLLLFQLELLCLTVGMILALLFQPIVGLAVQHRQHRQLLAHRAQIRQRSHALVQGSLWLGYFQCLLSLLLSG